jgi:hypothetical protein
MSKMAKRWVRLRRLECADRLLPPRFAELAAGLSRLERLSVRCSREQFSTATGDFGLFCALRRVDIACGVLDCDPPVRLHWDAAPALEQISIRFHSEFDGPDLSFGCLPTLRHLEIHGRAQVLPSPTWSPASLDSLRLACVRGASALLVGATTLHALTGIDIRTAADIEAIAACVSLTHLSLGGVAALDGGAWTPLSLLTRLSRLETPFLPPEMRRLSWLCELGLHQEHPCVYARDYRSRRAAIAAEGVLPIDSCDRAHFDPERTAALSEVIAHMPMLTRVDRLMPRAFPTVASRVSTAIFRASAAQLRDYVSPASLGESARDLQTAFDVFAADYQALCTQDKRAPYLGEIEMRWKINGINNRTAACCDRRAATANQLARRAGAHVGTD